MLRSPGRELPRMKNETSTCVGVDGSTKKKDDSRRRRKEKNMCVKVDSMLF